jgi:hypothetical protein
VAMTAAAFDPRSQESRQPRKWRFDAYPISMDTLASR